MVNDPDCVYVVLTCADGFTLWMRIHKTVRTLEGTIVRSGEVDAGYVWNEINRNVIGWRTPRLDGTPGVMVAHLPIVSWRPIDPSEIPDSMCDPFHPLAKYRDAARDPGAGNGPLVHDLAAAGELAVALVKQKRIARFKPLDDQWTSAKGQKDEAAADAIDAKRQVLRDAPAVVASALSKAVSIEDIHAAVQAALVTD